MEGASFVQMPLTEHRWNMGRKKEQIKPTAISSSLWKPLLQGLTAVCFGSEQERSTFGTGRLQHHPPFTPSLSQFSAVNHRGGGEKREISGSESCCYKATAWTKSSISVSLLPKSQERAAFPSAVVVLAPPHTENTENKAFFLRQQWTTNGLGKLLRGQTSELHFLPTEAIDALCMRL